jgi:hypothetical protein
MATQTVPYYVFLCFDPEGWELSSEDHDGSFINLVRQIKETLVLMKPRDNLNATFDGQGADQLKTNSCNIEFLTNAIFASAGDLYASSNTIRVPAEPGCCLDENRQQAEPFPGLLDTTNGNHRQ